MAADETLQRLRRIETRVTEMAIVMGVGHGAQKPDYCLGRVTIPSIHASLASILEALSADDRADVDVFIGEKYLCRIRR